jgi:transposase
MRGTTDPQLRLSALTPNSPVPPDHPIRRIKVVVEAVLAELSPEFDAMYPSTGRHSVPPEQLLKASILMALYTIRSERQFCERLRYDLLFKFFLDLNADDEGFDHSTFSGNREWLLEHEIADRFFAAVVKQANLRRYISGEHFSIDGTLLEAWASHTSFRPKDGGPGEPPPPGRNAEVDYHGERRSNEAHPLDDRPRGTPGAQGQRRGCQAQLRRAPAARAPQCLDRRHRAHPGDRIRRAGGGAHPAAPASETSEAAHGRWRQGLRHQGLRGRLPGDRRDAPRGTEHDQPAQRDRRAHHQAPGSRRQPADPHNASRNRSAGSRRSPAAASFATSVCSATGPGS